MPSYVDRLNPTTVGRMVGAVRTSLAELHPDALTLLELQASDILQRISRLMDEVTAVVSVADPLILPNGYPEALTNSLNAINNGLIEVSANRFPPSADGLMSYADHLAAQLLTWPRSTDAEAVHAAVIRVTSTLRSESTSFTEAVVTVASELRQQLSELATTADALGVDMNSQVSALGTSVAALNAQATSNIERIDAALARQDATFTKQQELQRRILNEELESIGSARLSAMMELTAEIDTAKDMVSVFAGAGTANAFSKEAAMQAGQADRWRLIALGLISGAAVAALLIMVTFANTNQGRIYETIGKATVGALLVGAAGYAARQSSLHRHREEVSRRSELRLVTLEPLIQNMDEGDQVKARAAAIDSIYAMPEIPTDGAAVSIGPEQIGLLQQLITALLSLRGK